MNTNETRRKPLLKLIPALFAFNFLVGLPGLSFADPADIVNRLNSYRSLERLHASKEISTFSSSRLGDSRLKNSVIVALQDTDENVRLNAISALQRLPPSDRIRRKLVQALANEESSVVRGKVACALVRSYPSSASIPLMLWVAGEVDKGRNILESMQSPPGNRARPGGDEADDLDCKIARNADTELRIIAGYLLSLSKRYGARQLQGYVTDPRAQIRWMTSTLLANSKPKLLRGTAMRAFQNQDIAVVAGAHKIFIRLGEDAFVPMLIEALSDYGTPSMAAHYLSSDHPELIAAARQWASSHGYRGFTSSRRPSLVWGGGKVQG